MIIIKKRKEKSKCLNPTKAHLPFNDNTIMITYNADFGKPYWKDTQKNYDIYIANLNFSSLECSDIDCKAKGFCKIHAYYDRTLILPKEKITLVILRVICKKCNTTHAILPSFIVPYSQVALADHIKILRFHVKKASANTISKSKSYKKSLIDVSNIKYIIKQFEKYWKQRLLSLALKLTADIDHFVKSCFDGYSQQFMQIKDTPNVLYFLNS